MKALLALLLIACAQPVVRPTRVAPAATAAPTLVIDSPAPGSFVREADVEVRGHFSTFDGRAWVHVDAIVADVQASQFVAHHVPLREGRLDLRVHLVDGQGRATEALLPLVVENLDRPRTRKICDEVGRCLAVEVRGIPRRDFQGLVVNAVIVLSAFGYSEALDELWPGLIGPARPLDPRRHLIFGITPARDERGRAPHAAQIPALLARLFTDEHLANNTVVIGASSFGAELVLHALAEGTIGAGPIVVCGGHDRPFAELAMKGVRKLLTQAQRRHLEPLAAWRSIATQMVALSYTPEYLADAAHASEHGIESETQAHGFLAALTERMAEVWAKGLPLEAMTARMDDAFLLEDKPLAFKDLNGRRVLFVANARDRMMSLPQIRACAERLTNAGAKVEVRTFDDELGHSAFFLRVPAALVRAILDVAGGLAPK